MNKERFQAAINYIGDDLIAEAADYKPKASKKAKPKGVIKFAGALACAAAVLAGAVGFRSWALSKFGGVSISNTPNDSISAIIDEVLKSGTESEVDHTADEIYQFPKDGESSPGVRYSPVYGVDIPYFENRCNADNVIWYSYELANTYGSKGNMTWEDDAFKYGFHPGSVKMSALLYNLITEEYDEDPIFAVRIYFDSDSYADELSSWKYKGFTYDDVTEMLKKAGNDEISAEELNGILDYIEYDYYLVQLQRFHDKYFKEHGLDIYPLDKGATIKGYKWFYCFMTAQEIASLTCLQTEAFYLDLPYKPENQ